MLQGDEQEWGPALLHQSKKDHLYHVVGDLVVTPFSLLSMTLDELERVIAACGNRRIFILSVLPRYFLKPCC